MRLLALASAALCALAPSVAAAQTPTDHDAPPQGRFADPTGGAYTVPTTLFVPAAALPSLMPRITLGADVQSTGRLSPVRPYLNAELGLPLGFTLAAGTQFLGGDPPRAGDSITPFAQVRYQLFGRADGMGPIGGVSVTYKRVGYRGGENEVEAAFSFQYRRPRFEVGAQGTFGQSLEEGEEHDLEARVYAAYRVLPSLAIGLSGQVRGDIGEEDEALRVAMGRNELDFTGGAIASYTISRWQFGALLGATNLGLVDQVAFLGQLQGQVRF